MSLPSYLRMLQVAEERQQNFDELRRLYNSIEVRCLESVVVCECIAFCVCVCLFVWCTSLCVYMCVRVSLTNRRTSQ